MESDWRPHELPPSVFLFFSFPLIGFAMRLITKIFSFPVEGARVLLSGAAWLCSRTIPKCTHSQNSYSFPRTVDGKTTRTCYKCGHKRDYDMNTMRFLTGHFVSTK